jgi:uncharacterized iron-regulated protein
MAMLNTPDLPDSDGPNTRDFSLEKHRRAFVDMRSVMVATLVFSLAACASAGSRITPVTPPVTPRITLPVASSATSASVAAPGYRIVSPATRTDVTMSEMLERLAGADVVFFGEQHDDPETHRAEAEILDAIGGLRRPVVVSLEMFERDVQPVLDDYLAGRISESVFPARSRPWPNYATGYRPLVELARVHHWPAVAANVPRPLASAVGRKGIVALDTLTPVEHLTVARKIICPLDDYYARFMDEMHAHSTGSGGAAEPGDSLPTAMAERFYVAQCVKDETMAESIVNAKRAGQRDAIVVHFTGAFHSDYAQGTVERVRRREPSWKLVVISAVPVADPRVAPIAPESGVADFVIFTKRPSH